MAGRLPINPDHRRRKTNLTLDPLVVDTAQEIASKAGVSLSELVNRLLKSLVEPATQSKKPTTEKMEEATSKVVKDLALERFL